MQFIRTTHTALLGLALASGLYAQHAAGHPGGAAPHSAPGVGRGVVTPTSRTNIGGSPYPVRTDIPTPPGLNSPASAYTGILPGAYNTPTRNYGHGNRFSSGIVAAPLFFPSYWDSGFSSYPGYDNSFAPSDPNAQVIADSQAALMQQIQQLSVEVQQMKSDNQQPTLPGPLPTPTPTVASPAPENRPATPPVTLVLRNGQQISVENYAVMNGTFWNLSKHPAQKISIMDIDISSSMKATEANGGEFPQLGSLQ